MLPLTFAFIWGTGQIIFLGTFFAIVAIIIATVATSLLRTMRSVKGNEVDAIRWKADFHDLPEASRTCRHEFTGEFKHRVCHNDFDCNVCEQHAKLVAHYDPTAHPIIAGTNLGFTLPLDRLYSRGHTWTRSDVDGTYVIGVDDFASRLIGTPTGVELPAVGTKLSINGTAWNFKKGAATVRLLSPIEGEVTETSDGKDGWYVRVKPLTEKMKTGHLLRDTEVILWIQREFDRLQNLLSDPKIGYTLPDGGTPITDFTAAFPDRDWEGIYSTLLLEP
jgi:glycine cleavage system H lipoate-binding protein